MSPSIYDVAQAAGVAVGTVSRVLNDAPTVRAETRRRVQEVILDLGYEPNRVARSLASGSTRSIALIVPDLANPFFAEVAAGSMEVADARGYAVIVCGVSDQPARERRYLDLMMARRVDGLLLVGSTLALAELARVAGTVPVVLVDRTRRLRGAHSVTVDHRRGAQLAIDHLVALGHRDIAILAGPRQITASRERLLGAQSAMQNHGIPLKPELLTHNAFDDQGGAAGMGRILDSRAPFTAVFASNDLKAIGAIAVLKRHGLRVPDDVSLVGFDDIHLARHIDPALTTVRQPAREMGRRAAEAVLSWLVDNVEPSNVVLAPELIQRESTSRAR